MIFTQHKHRDKSITVSLQQNLAQVYHTLRGPADQRQRKDSYWIFNPTLGARSIRGAMCTYFVWLQRKSMRTASGDDFGHEEFTREKISQAISDEKLASSQVDRKTCWSPVANLELASQNSNFKNLSCFLPRLTIIGDHWQWFKSSSIPFQAICTSINSATSRAMRQYIPTGQEPYTGKLLISLGNLQ